MMELMERADPARDMHADANRLRTKVDERIGVSGSLSSLCRGVA